MNRTDQPLSSFFISQPSSEVTQGPAEKLGIDGIKETEKSIFFLLLETPGHASC